MNIVLKLALTAAAAALAAQASAQVTFYEGEGFEGRTFIATQQVDDLAQRGFNDRASSVVVASDRWEVCEDARFGGRCVILRKGKEVAQSPTSNVNVPGAIVRAVLGGILGHQVGGGVGKQLATAGGAVAGGVLGANVGRSSATQPVRTQEVQRCAAAPPSAARPDYWDVTYSFQGRDHRVQMTTPPGATVTVNDQGEPRA